MFAFLFILIIVWLIMWGFFKFMYPTPPKAFMPKQGDIITPRHCDFCGYPLAEYRGVLEQKPDAAFTADQLEKIKQAQIRQASDNDNIEQIATNSKLSRQQKKALKKAQLEKEENWYQQQQELKKMTTWFFCNYEHQASFHEKQPVSNMIDSVINKSH